MRRTAARRPAELRRRTCRVAASTMRVEVRKAAERVRSAHPASLPALLGVRPAASDASRLCPPLAAELCGVFSTEINLKYLALKNL